MPLIPIIASATGLVIGWVSNDAVSSVKSDFNEVQQTVKTGTNYAAVGIAAVIGFVVLKKLKVF
jgi:hypothetical protein